MFNLFMMLSFVKLNVDIKDIRIVADLLLLMACLLLATGFITHCLIRHIHNQKHTSRLLFDPPHCLVAPCLLHFMASLVYGGSMGGILHRIKWVTILSLCVRIYFILFSQQVGSITFITLYSFFFWVSLSKH